MQGLSPAWESTLRGLGIVVAIAICGWLANATNITAAVGPQWAYILSAVAAVALNALDKANSPAGTVGFGTLGVRR